MTNLLTIPDEIGRSIAEDGAMLLCQLLGTRRFLRFCTDRGIAINGKRLIRLERLGVFAPVFRVRTPQEPIAPFGIPPNKDNNWFTKGLAYDTTAVPHKHEVPAYGDETGEGYYSVFQVHHLHFVLAQLTHHVQMDSYLDQPQNRLIDWQKQGDKRMQLAESRVEVLRDYQHRHAVALLCQHVSNRYLPEAQTDMRTTQMRSGYFCDAWITIHSRDWNWYQEVQHWDPKRIEKLYNLTPQKLRHAYEGLATAQASCDPIEHWYPLIQFISLRERSRLKGDALRAETMRSGAQMLRLLYEDLYGDDLPHPNEVSRIITSPTPELEVRQDIRRYLEFVTNRFGINPQPRLTLFVEGKSEEVAVTRIFELCYGAHTSIYGIEIICLHGVDNATGGKGKYQNFSGIVRLIDYLHHHQTVVFLILDNENTATKLQEKLREAHSIHGKRLVIKDEYVKIWEKSFEFDNFSDAEIAAALTKFAQERVSFNKSEVTSVRKEHRQSITNLESLYKSKINYKLDKICLAKILVDTIISYPSCQEINNRPIIKTLNRVRCLAIQNCLPIMQEIMDANQGSGFFGDMINREEKPNTPFP